jgi:hypothetical protein
MRHLFSILNSKKLKLMLISSYCITIIFSYFFLSHSVDDIFYFGPAVNLFENGKYALSVGHKTFTVFYLFPTFSLFNGFFLEVTNILSVPIDHLSYRLFSKIIILFLFFSIIHYVNRLNNGSIAAENLAIVILMTSPFMLGSVGSVRPEPLGVLLVCWSLLLFFNWQKLSKAKNLFFSNFFLGLACITHPIFIIPSMLIGIYMLASSFRSCGIIIMLKSFLILVFPLTCYLIWLISNFEMAYIELSNRVINSNSGFFNILLQNLNINIFSILSSFEASFTTAIYRFYFSYPFHILLAIVILNLLTSSSRIKNPELFFGLVGTIINFIFIPHYDFHYALLVFFTICIATSLFYERIKN